MTHSLRASTLGWLMTALLLAPTAAAETYVVISTADNGAVGTLRWAIEQANATTDLDTILIAVGSNKTLTLKSVIETPLPLDITEAVIIDSSASPGLTVTRGLASESFEINGVTTWTDLHLATMGGFLLDDDMTFDQDTLAGEVSARIEGTGALVKTGTESLTLSGNNSYSGGTTVDEGELIVSADSLGTGDVSLADDTTLTFNETGSEDFSGTISGSGKVVKDGSGSITLEKTSFDPNGWSGGTEVKDGTLISKGIGGLPPDSDVSLTSSTAVFEFELDDDEFYGGVISGSGSFTKSGLGELELTGLNLHTGGTTITEGSLLITAVSNLPSTGGVAISSDALLTLDGVGVAAPETLALALSGAGGLLVFGNSDVVLSGNNSFSGGILIEAGTVTGTTSSIPGDVDFDVSQANLIFDQDFDGTHAGEIIGLGSVVKEGTGTVHLTGTNDFEMPAVVREGVLAVTTLSLPPADDQSTLCSFVPGGFTGYSACVESGATLRFDQDFDGDFDGLIVSEGGVEKSGSGSVTITENQEYTGDTKVLAGELVLDANLDPSSNVFVSDSGTLRLAELGYIEGDIDVELGGTLSGIGYILGNVLVRNGGTVAPDNVADLAPLTLDADIDFETGSTFAVSINDLGEADELYVDGTVTVGSGVTLEVSVADGDYSLGAGATVLFSLEDFSGENFEFIDDYAFLLVQVDQAFLDEVSVDVELDTTVDIASYAQTGNEASVGAALSAAGVIGSGSALDQALQPLEMAQVPAALEQLAGIPLTSSFTVRRAESLAFRRGLASRIRDYADRGGPARAFEADTEGFTPPVRQYRHRRFFAPSHGEHSWNGSGRSASPPAATGPGAWVGAYGSFGEMEDSVDAPGFDYDFYGGAAGADFRMTDSLLLGASVAYAHAKLDGYDRIAASGSGDSVRGALYGAYAHPELGAYVGLQLAYAWSDFEDHRWLRFGGLDSRASASVTGNEFSGYAEIGPRAFTFGEVRLRPFMGIGYAWFDSQGFTESGAPAGANLSVDSGSYQSLELGPGLLADQVIDLGPGFKLRTELRARYTHEFLDTNPKLDASISGSAFEVQGKSPGRHMGLLGASLEFIDRGGVTTYLAYDFRGNTDMREHTASAGIQVRF